MFGFASTDRSLRRIVGGATPLCSWSDSPPPIAAFGGLSAVRLLCAHGRIRLHRSQPSADCRRCDSSKVRHLLVDRFVGSAGSSVGGSPRGASVPTMLRGPR